MAIRNGRSAAAALAIAILLGVAGPASAQSTPQVTSVKIAMTTPAGSITSCPPALTFTVTVGENEALAESKVPIVNFHFIDSAGDSFPLQGVSFPSMAQGNAAFTKGPGGTQTATLTDNSLNKWSAPGTYWVEAATMAPNNIVTSNKVYFQLTCPTLGNLTLTNGP